MLVDGAAWPRLAGLAPASRFKLYELKRLKRTFRTHNILK